MVHAREWPQWRGPARDGVIDFAAPSSWPRELTRTWTTTVGSGYSSAVATENTVFVLGREGEKEIVTALRLSDGARQWSDSYPAAYTIPMEASARHGKGPRATPVLHRKMLFTYGISAVLSSYDADTGKLRWRKNTADEFGGKVMEFGTSMSPLIDAERLIVHIGHENAGAVVAYDADTGIERWRWSGDGPSYSSPVVATIAATRQIILASNGSIVGLSAESGALLWQFPYPRIVYPLAVSPIVYRDTVMMSTNGKSLMAIRVVAAKAGAAWRVEKAWESDGVAMTLSTPVLSGDYLYGLADRNRGQLFCVDARDGRIAWTSTGREGDMASTLRSQSLVWFLKGSGELVIANAVERGFEPIAKYQLADALTWSAPIVLGKQLLVRHGEELSAWQLP